MQKENFKKIILINISVFILLFIALEVSFFNMEKTRYTKEAELSDGYFDARDIKYQFKMHDFTIHESGFRPISDFGSKHKILLFGGSFSYGSLLKKEKIFSELLAQKTKSKVYNRAQSGWGAQHMLYQLQQKDFYKKIEEPDYIIYTFMEDHLNRFHKYQWGAIWSNTVNLRYKKNGEEFIEIKPILKDLWFLFVVKEVQIFIEHYSNSKKNQYKNIKFFEDIMEEALKLTKKHYPNSKFILLIYPIDKQENPKLTQMYKNLSQKGFIVLNVKELTRANLQSPEYGHGADLHPTDKAWEQITDGLIKKLNL